MQNSFFLRYPTLLAFWEHVSLPRSCRCSLKCRIRTCVTWFPHGGISLNFWLPRLMLSMWWCFYRAHRKYDARVMFSEFLSFCPQKIEKSSECEEKSKNALKSFHNIHPLTKWGELGWDSKLWMAIVAEIQSSKVWDPYWWHLVLNVGTETPSPCWWHLVDKVVTKTPPPRHIGHSPYGCVLFAIEIRIAL